MYEFNLYSMMELVVLVLPQDSEEDEHEETEEEFMERCAETASALDDGVLVEEGDIDDQDVEIELGNASPRSSPFFLLFYHVGLMWYMSTNRMSYTIWKQI